MVQVHEITTVSHSFAQFPQHTVQKKQTRTPKIDAELAHLSHQMAVSIFLDALPKNRRGKQTRSFRCGVVTFLMSISPCLFLRVYFTPCLFCACLFLALGVSIFEFPCLFLHIYIYSTDQLRLRVSDGLVKDPLPGVRLPWSSGPQQRPCKNVVIIDVTRKNVS